MKNPHQEVVLEQKHTRNNANSALAGLLIGGLAGAGAALLFAPQSGKETRHKIQQKTIELRDRTTEKVEDTVAQVKSKTDQITADVHKKADELQQYGQEVIVQQLDRVSEAAESGKAALTSHTDEEEILTQF